MAPVGVASLATGAWQEHVHRHVPEAAISRCASEQAVFQLPGATDVTTSVRNGVARKAAHNAGGSTARSTVRLGPAPKPHRFLCRPDTACWRFRPTKRELGFQPASTLPPGELLS